MILKIKVRPKSGKQGIEKMGEHEYKVSLKSTPQNNKANIELIKFLSKELNVSSSNISIVKGFKSRDKIIQII